MTEINDFPKMNINTAELMAAIESLLGIAEEMRGVDVDFGAANWGDLGIADIEYRLSMLRPSDGPICMVTIEEAAPECKLAQFLYDNLDKEKFPNVYFECKW